MDCEQEWRYGKRAPNCFGNAYPVKPSNGNQFKTLWGPAPYKATLSRPSFYGGVEYTYALDKKYLHLGNNCWYHPTDCGRWVPVAGQGMEIYPRVLNETYLDGYSPKHSFKVGDIVRLKTGVSPIRIEVINKTRFTGEYTVSGTRVVARSVEDITLHEDYNNNETQEENTMTTNSNTLYEIRISGASTLEQLQYGHYLATNSSGQWVMEEKGTGRIHTVDKADVQEVLPHTIGVQLLDGGVGQTYNYFADKDKYSVGQVFIMNNSLATVVGVDTKSRKATKDFNPTVEVLTKKVD